MGQNTLLGKFPGTFQETALAPPHTSGPGFENGPLAQAPPNSAQKSCPWGSALRIGPTCACRDPVPVGQKPVVGEVSRKFTRKFPHIEEVWGWAFGTSAAAPCNFAPKVACGKVPSELGQLVRVGAQWAKTRCWGSFLEVSWKFLGWWGSPNCPSGGQGWGPCATAPPGRPWLGHGQWGAKGVAWGGWGAVQPKFSLNPPVIVLNDYVFMFFT